MIKNMKNTSKKSPKKYPVVLATVLTCLGSVLIDWIDKSMVYFNTNIVLLLGVGLGFYQLYKRFNKQLDSLYLTLAMAFVVLYMKPDIDMLWSGVVALLLLAKCGFDIYYGRKQKMSNSEED